MFTVITPQLRISGGGGDPIDTEFTGATITFGPAVSPWDPGQDYGSVTLIHCFTDSGSRNVFGLAVRNAVNGTIVGLKQEGSIAIPGGTSAGLWNHLAGGTGQFSNSGAATASGQALGCCWYRYADAATHPSGIGTWVQIYQTAGM